MQDVDKRSHYYTKINKGHKVTKRSTLTDYEQKNKGSRFNTSTNVNKMSTFTGTHNMNNWSQFTHNMNKDKHLHIQKVNHRSTALHNKKSFQYLHK
jgi:hypothetical protein